MQFFDKLGKIRLFKARFVMTNVFVYLYTEEIIDFALRSYSNSESKTKYCRQCSAVICKILVKHAFNSDSHQLLITNNFTNSNVNKPAKVKNNQKEVVIGS